MSTFSMKTLLRGLALGLVLPLCSPSMVRGTDGARTNPPGKNNGDVLLSTMQRELRRAQAKLGQLDPAPYFASYSVYDQQGTVVVGGLGSLLNFTQFHRRTGEVTMRVGSVALDNTHQENRNSGIDSGLVPLEDDADAVARVLWQLTYEEYRRAAQSYLNVKTAAAVRTQEEDTSADFAQAKPEVHLDYAMPVFHLDRKDWEDRVRRYSSNFRKYPEIYSSAVMVIGEQTQMRFVSTDGTQLATPGTIIRMMIEAETRADDGMELLRVETFQASTPDGLPGDAEIAAKIAKMASDLKALRTAPTAEPFDGPALLSGRAAAVFFHEVLGHRLEGHRQRGDQEGQTFTKKINQQVLPTFLSVVDDPTQRSLNGMELGGWYQYDDEGVPAQRVEVIKDGILRNFLMSRMPVKGFSQSNGHGRAQPGLMATGRQGNLIVTSSHTAKDSEMRQKLIDEIKKQGKPYGLYFEDIEGGFTLTTRSLPQSFQILPVLVWKVYPDGRPDELVRGVDIVGTPLAALNRIEITGEKTEVFNGICGAESGSVPVSAAAPAMLFSEMEVQKRAHSRARPPILPPPSWDKTTAAGPRTSAFGPLESDSPSTTRGRQ
ncbi:MAG: TldD/PmbA family protein [Terriglobales bacterium]